MTTTPVNTAETTSQTRTKSSARTFDERICNEVGKDCESPTQIRRIAVPMAECEKLSISDDIAEARRIHLEKLTKVKDAIIKVAPRTDATTKPGRVTTRSLTDRWVDIKYDEGARKTRWTTRGYEQTTMVRCTLWPKTYYEWYEVWPNPPEIAEAEVGTMLDNIDLDFDQSQTTSTKQKYTNCTNDIKSVLKGRAAAIEYYSGAFYQSPLNPGGTESKVWIELLEKATLGRNYVWEAASAFPGLKGVPNFLGYIQRERSHEFRADGAVTIRRLLVLSFRTKSRTSRAESRKTHQRLPGDRTSSAFWHRRKDKLNLQNTVRLHKTGDKGRLSAMNLRNLEKGYELQDKLFLPYSRICRRSRDRKCQNKPYTRIHQPEATR